MTTINHRADKHNIKISIDGHAEYGPAGNDIVCASVSILATTLIQELLNNTNNIKYKMKSGEVEVVVENTNITRQIVKTIITGFELLQDQYPKNIKIF